MLFRLDNTPRALTAPTPETAARLLKVDQTLSEAFGKLAQGCDYPYATGAEWSTHDLLAYLLAQIGPAELVACTWSMEEHAVVKLLDLMAAGQLTRIHMLVDWRVQVRTPSAHALAKSRFADLRITTCHAKVFVLRNDAWALSCVGSANFTNNPRIEAGHLSTSPAVADFHEHWIRAELQNAKPFGLDMREARPAGRA